MVEKTSVVWGCLRQFKKNKGCPQPSFATNAQVFLSALSSLLSATNPEYICIFYHESGIRRPGQVVFVCLYVFVHVYMCARTRTCGRVLWLHIWCAGIYRSVFLFQRHDCTFLRGTALCLAAGNMHYVRVTLGVCKRHIILFWPKHCALMGPRFTTALQGPPSPTLQWPWCTCHWHKLVSVCLDRILSHAFKSVALFCPVLLISSNHSSV